MNALEAINNGGQIAIRFSHLPEDHRLVVDIADTGPGVPPELLPKIFETFVTTKPEGSGLGLAICRAIADAHRTAIRAENNTSGPGMKVVLEFPVLETTS
jgi:signal transduction histidine kinase